MKTLYKFSASWCQPCKQLSKVLAEVDTSNYTIIEIDIDEDVVKTASYGIRGVPTLVILDENLVEVNRKTGSMTKAQLEQFLS